MIARFESIRVHQRVTRQVSHLLSPIVHPQTSSGLCSCVSLIPLRPRRLRGPRIHHIRSERDIFWPQYADLLYDLGPLTLFGDGLCPVVILPVFLVNH